MPLALVAAFSLGLSLADVGPNTSRVLLALIGAVASTLNTWLLYRNRRERRRHQAEVRAAIGGRGLVAMVPEAVVKDVEGAQAPPEPPKPAA